MEIFTECGHAITWIIHSKPQEFNDNWEIRAINFLVLLSHKKSQTAQTDDIDGNKVKKKNPLNKIKQVFLTQLAVSMLPSSAILSFFLNKFSFSSLQWHSPHESHELCSIHEMRLRRKKISKRNAIKERNKWEIPRKK